jgi:hypothetical protein
MKHIDPNALEDAGWAKRLEVKSLHLESSALFGDSLLRAGVGADRLFLLQ